MKQTYQCVCGLQFERDVKEYNRSIKKCGIAYCSNSCSIRARRIPPRIIKICKCGQNYSGLDKSHMCRCCKKEYNKRWYEKNKTKHIAQSGINRKRERNRRHILMLKYYETHPCVDCGETHPATLDFDHQGDKRTEVSKLLNSHGWQAVLDEINKCEIRCANCHRKRTAKQFNWYNGLVT
jgi:hypothetical protein